MTVTRRDLLSRRRPNRPPELVFATGNVAALLTQQPAVAGPAAGVPARAGACQRVHPAGLLDLPAGSPTASSTRWASFTSSRASRSVRCPERHDGTASRAMPPAVATSSRNQEQGGRPRSPPSPLRT